MSRAKDGLWNINEELFIDFDLPGDATTFLAECL